jgi:tetratricopeptide (TPR) repeat protein
MKGKPGLLEALGGSGPLKLGFGAKFAIFLAALAILSVTSLAQENLTEDWLEKAHELHRNGTPEEMLDAYNKAIEIDPQNFQAWLGKGIAESTLGYHGEASSSFEKALDLCDEAIEADSEDADAWYFRAEILFRMGRTDEAIEAYDRVIEIRPGDYLTMERKAEYFLALGRYDEALETFEGAIELQPADDTDQLALVWSAKAQILEIFGRYDDALEALDRAIELDPEDAYYRIIKGYVASEAGRSDDSIAAYDEALLIDPESTSAWSAKASELAHVKRYEESLEAYDGLLLVDPSSAQGWLDKGDVLEKMGRTDEARDAFMKSLEASDEALSNDTATMVVRGGALFRLARYEEVVAAYDEAVEGASPYSLKYYTAQALSGKGDLLRAQGKNDEAILAYDQAIDIEPTLSEAWHGKGLAQNALGRVTDAGSSFYVSGNLGY